MLELETLLSRKATKLGALRAEDAADRELFANLERQTAECWAALSWEETLEHGLRQDAARNEEAELQAELAIVASELDEVSAEPALAAAEEASHASSAVTAGLRAHLAQELAEHTAEEAEGATLHEEVAERANESAELQAQLERRGRRLRRLERERRQFVEQEAALRECEERIATVSEACVNRYDLPFTSASPIVCDEEVAAELDAALRELGYDDDASVPGSCTGTAMLLRASRLEAAALTVHTELRGLPFCCPDVSGILEAPRECEMLAVHHM